MVIHELNHACKFADHIIGIKKGELLFEGSPKNVIYPESLRELYEIESTLMSNKHGDYPVCTDYSLLPDDIRQNP